MAADSELPSTRRRGRDHRRAPEGQQRHHHRSARAAVDRAGANAAVSDPAE
ncbi:hypothetical protein [Nocardia otitidiscaviarum]|uniref:hypothetical protein n=1 Tax=Nocardia otitidiscaviarum TaxID=1823 RepID=UPI0024578221|nr:hypothetical protein [Nocardia otitidiscaviarum]